MKKVKYLSMLIAVFGFGLIPTTILAANGNVASVDGTEYATVQDAINDANGKTVTLLADVTESITIADGTIVTLDLGNYTLTNVDKQHTITNKGTLTIQGNGTVDNVSHAKGALVNNGTVILKSGILTRSKEAGSSATNNGGNSWYVVDNNEGTFNMEGGKIISTSLYSSGIRNLKATFNMAGGTISNGFIALKNDDNGIINMTGGTVSTTSAGGSAIQNWGNLNMTGGTLNAVEGAAAIYTLNWSADFNPVVTTISNHAVINGDIQMYYDTNYPKLDTMPELIVNGGTINGSIVDKTNCTITVNGGTINGTITSAENGTITIAPADYSKVEKALENAKAIDTSLYTKESVEKLTAAINAVVYEKTILEQDEVDQMAKNIEAAIAGLETKEVQNPNTADINVIALIIMMLAGTVGLGYTIKKRFN